MSEDCLSRIKVFNGENFSLWKFQFRLLLEQQKLLELLEGLEIKPNVVSSDSNSESSLQNWKSKDVKARMLLSQAIELRFLQPLMNCTSASQMWQKLLAIHEQKSEFTIGLLWQQFFDARLTSETISDYIAKIETISAQISQMGGTITDDQKVAKILNTLPSSMRYFVAAGESLDPKAQTLNNLTARLSIEETRNQQSGSSKQDEALLHRQARTKPKDTQRSFQDAKKNTKCHYCHKIGHWSRECRKRLANEKNKSKNLHDSKGSSSDYGLILCDNQVEPNDIWYADSGASCSMTFRREWFKTYTPFTSDHPIYLGDNSTLLAEGMGDIEIQAYVDGGWYNMYIRNVLYSPQLKKNLYSLSTSTRRGFNVIIKHDKLQIFMDNDLKAVGVRHDGLYRMLFKVTSSSQGYITSENKLQLWHERLAHLPVATLREMATKGLVDGLQPQDLEGEFFFCEGCQLGKAHRKSCYPSDGKNYQQGYENTSKNFRLWDWKTRKIRISKDVTFDEKATPDRESTKPKEIIFQINSAPDESPVATANIPVQEMPPVSDISSHPMITRSKVSNSQCNFALADEPSNYIDAITSSDSERWKLAMDEEIDALNKNKTWTLERLADGHKPIGCKWVYKIKTESDGTIQRFKARLVAKGYSQIKNFDYFDTFSPVVRYDSLRILLSHAASERMFLKQFDVKTAFLNGELEELVYLEQPEGYKRDDNSCYRLHKSLYGLKQSSRNWNKKFTNFLYSHNFKTSDADPCIFIGTHNDSNVIVALYVDDGIILSKDKEAIAIIMDELEHAFEITSGSVNFFVGLQIEQSEDRASIFIHQSSYIDKILSKFNMADCIPASVPMDPSVILTKTDCPTPEQKEKMPKFPFREAVGSLMFASCVSRPDITYAVSQVSKFQEYPGPAHCTTVKNIFRYLKGTPHMGILFTGQDQLVGYSDSDFARDVDSRKSTTGYAFMMNGGTVSWASQRQSIIALSTTESEYIAACSAAKELIWIRRLLQGIGCDITKETELYIDNQAAIKLVENPVFHKRTKHIDVRYHFIRSKHEEGKLRLAYLENPKASWTQLVKRITQTYSNTPHSVTSFPPTYLMFNVVPPDLRTHLNPYPEITRAREIARSRTQNKHKKDKETFDNQHRTPHFEVNDLVLVKNYRNPDTGKLAPYFTGPYTIIEIISPNVVRIDRPNQPLNRDSDTIHVNKLKYYTENVLYITPPQLRFVQNPQRMSPDVYLSELNHLTPDIFEEQLFRIIPPTTFQPFLHLNPDLFNIDRFKTNLKTAWHRRLGHPSGNKLDLILKNNLLKGLNSINGTLDQCDACSLGKMTKVPYVHTDSNQESYPFEAIYVDLCGQMRINSLGGSKYFLTIVELEQYLKDSMTTFWLLRMKPFRKTMKKPSHAKTRNIGRTQCLREEIQNMYSHQVWELIPRPVNAKVVKSKWVFKISKDQENKNKTYKARLVAMGYNQIPGRDYNESFSPVIKNATLRTILSMAATKDSFIKLFDVKAAYLNGNIENTIFMEQPAGFVQDRNKVCKLNKSIYGLPQSGRSWYEKFSQVLHDCGLEKLKSDPCLFKWKNEDKYFYVGIYVDDFITVSDSEDTSNRFINKLRHHLEIKDVTCKGMFLGIKIIQDKDGISLQQSHYVQQILQKYGMENCKEVPTPGSKEINLDNHIEDDNCDQHTYQEALGMLMFLAVNTRPDIAYITSKLSQYSRQPKQMHWTAIKRVMRYLRGTIDLGVKFERGKTGILKSYTDASWSTTHDGKSYGGYVLKLGEATIDWKSSKQPLVALSTMEAEMIAACESCCQIKRIINLLRELEEWNFMEKPTAIYTDSQSLINWISSPKQSSRCRHINRKYHLLRDCYESRDICLLYKPSQDLEADIFTKDLSRGQMKKHLENLSIVGIKTKQIWKVLVGASLPVKMISGMLVGVWGRKNREEESGGPHPEPRMLLPSCNRKDCQDHPGLWGGSSRLSSGEEK
ncbi:hypothetical protein LAZ67_9002406, partial [Cordylochernes scorpioides]